MDSVPDLAFCLDRVLEELRLPPAGVARVRDWMGDGLTRFIERALAATTTEPDAALVTRAKRLFLSLYATHTSERSTLYTDAVSSLEHLRAGGARLACVTNKYTRYTKKLLSAFGLTDFFDLVVSGDTLDTRKPDPGPLLHVADTFGVSPDTCLVVGDSMNDIEAARRAGFSIICVSYGYNRGLDIRSAGSDAVIDSLAELESVLQKVA